MATTLVERVATDASSQVQGWRPWMSMYGIRLKQRGQPENKALRGTRACIVSLPSCQAVTPPLQHLLRQVPQAPIQRLLPVELMLLIFERLPIAATARGACVCQQWRWLARRPELWRAACAEVFQRASPERNARLLRGPHRGSWRDMWLDRPHLRHDGLYVSRNTYLKTGIVEWRVKNPVALVCYYRYCRFFPDGSFLYRTTPDTVSRVARSLWEQPRGKQRAADDTIQSGLWRLDDHRLYTAMVYRNSHSTEVRTKLGLRSTIRGANDRLDILNVVSVDKADGSTVPLLSTAEEDDEAAAAVQGHLMHPGGRAHKRGLAPYVFISWDQVGNMSHPLNLGVDRMDVFIPG